jgi:hypothetical protein
MRRSRALITLLFPVAFLITAATPLAMSGKSTDTSVTTTIDGFGVDTSPTLRIQSDQLGTYKNSSTVQTVIQPIGAWVLDTNFSSSSTRSVLIDFRDPVPGSGPNGGDPIAPFAYAQVKARLIARCNDYGGSMLNMNGVGSTLTCPLAVAFTYGPNSYRINMNYLNFAEANPVVVTCESTDASSKCKQWRIEPSVTQADGERKNVTKLLKLASTKRETDQDYGDFYMSFVIHVTNP